MEVYARLGLIGCCGSTDCVHIHWDRCPAQQRNNHGEGRISNAFILCDLHTFSSHYCHYKKGIPGATIDKTISKYDIHLPGSCNNSIYPDVSFTLDNSRNDDKEDIQHPWLLCDGGYHKWKSMQCPVKHTSDEDLCRW